MSFIMIMNEDNPRLDVSYTWSLTDNILIPLDDNTFVTNNRFGEIYYCLIGQAVVSPQNLTSPKQAVKLNFESDLFLLSDLTDDMIKRFKEAVVKIAKDKYADHLDKYRWYSPYKILLKTTT